MSAKAIREYHGKRLLSEWLPTYSGDTEFHLEGHAVLITADSIDSTNPQSSFDSIAERNSWMLEPGTKLVVKPDQLIKRRGKAGLLGINLTWPEVVTWIMDHLNKDCQVEQVHGILDHFLVEPFVPHKQAEEFYVCIQSCRLYDEVLFTHEGGVDVGDVDSKSLRLQIPTGKSSMHVDEVSLALLEAVPILHRERLASFIISLWKVFQALNFVYLEINPLIMTADGKITPLDMAAKIDETAHFINAAQWGNLDFPAPFGRAEFPEEAYIKKLDMQSGASLKLTILNQYGRIWTMVAGGGASVVYADTVCDLGFGEELANYGEYSGAPTLQETYEYASTIFKLMCRHKDPAGRDKILIIGGGIANFTDVAATFKGIEKALFLYRAELLATNVQIWVRRAGPNFQEGLMNMRRTADELGLKCRLFGPETHMTAIVPLALGLRNLADYPEFDSAMESRTMLAATRAHDNENSNSTTSTTTTSTGMYDSSTSTEEDAAAEFYRKGTWSGCGGGGQDQDPASGAGETKTRGPDDEAVEPSHRISTRALTAFEYTVSDSSPETKSIVYGLQTTAVQGMLDFDYMCQRAKPSVVAMVFPFSGNHYSKFYWGTEEMLIPVYISIREACTKHPDASVMINFASYRSVYETVLEVFEFSNHIKTIAIIAEGVPESQTRNIIRIANEKGVGLIGPATVGGIKPGCFRIGNTGGMLDNIVMSKLYRPGSVAYVSKSGGMSNELNNIISRNSDGVYEGVAIGGDRYPGSQFLDHLLRYNDNPGVKMMVLLGEVGGVDEYAVCEAIRCGRITKPLVAWVMGTCASIFPYEVQFGHAGAMARGDLETATSKNAALRAAGAIVPSSFDEIGLTVYDMYAKLVRARRIVPAVEPPIPKIPMDYLWAKRLGLIRKPAAFISSISDDRGDELTYSGMPISKAIEEDIGVGGVLSLLWFRRRLPLYATKFIEIILMVSADHGPAVAGAHSTIVAARAGKDLVSSLASGLLTIGPRFGGALDEAAQLFKGAIDDGVTPAAFVANMRRQNKLIMGIGHKVRTLQNPDKRVQIIKEYAKQHFVQTPVLDFAMAVEQITTKKKSTLILNVDGCIAAAFVDLIRSCGAFDRAEGDDLIANGCLNGLFVCGRSIGFIGHFIDQKRLKQGLYRHPWDDISYQTNL